MGGAYTQVNEFPMMVGLIDLNMQSLICGGVIVSNYYVVSAAHCLKGLTPRTLEILVGDHDISTGATIF